MFTRKARGTTLQDFGRSFGGTIAALGCLAFCKAVATPSQEPGSAPTIVYSSSYSDATGDMFAPFAHTHSMMWIGAAGIIAGSLMRVKSYWSLHKEQS